MTPEEKITAAIQRLEKLKNDSTPGPWDGHQNILGNVRIRNSDHWIVSEVYGPDDYERAEINADLIVTLHRTLDAQLAILRGALGGARDLDMGHTPDEPASTVDALNLADAILGES